MELPTFPKEFPGTLMDGATAIQGIVSAIRDGSWKEKKESIALSATYALGCMAVTVLSDQPPIVKRSEESDVYFEDADSSYLADMLEKSIPADGTVKAGLFDWATAAKILLEILLRLL